MEVDEDEDEDVDVEVSLMREMLNEEAEMSMQGEEYDGWSFLSLEVDVVGSSAAVAGTHPLCMWLKVLIPALGIGEAWVGVAAGITLVPNIKDT